MASLDGRHSDRDIEGRKIGWAAGVVGILLLTMSCSKHAPVDAAFVNDEAEMLTEAEDASVSAWHSALLAQPGIDYRVLTVTRTDASWESGWRPVQSS